MRFDGMRQREKFQTLSFTNRNHSSGVPNARGFIGRVLTKRICRRGSKSCSEYHNWGNSFFGHLDFDI
jgi:hypothetical protein